MCGRFAVTTDPALLAEKIKALDEATAAAQQAGRNSAVVPNYNVAPTTTVSTVVRRHTETDDEATRRVRSMRWGLLPPWVKANTDGSPVTKGPLLINARAELAEIPVGNGSLRFAAWGKNLDDEEYWNTALNLGVLTVNQWADPRSYGLEVGYEF